MLNGLVVGAMSLAALAQPSDTIISAGEANRVEVEMFQGEVIVRTWDRNEVQVQADLPQSFTIDVTRSGSAIYIEPDAERGFGFSRPVDLEVTVPQRFDVSLEGIALTAEVIGVGGEVEVTTVHGPIHLEGGRGSIVLESVNGAVHVEGAEGDMEIVGIAGGVTMIDCVGDIVVESIGGDLTLEGVRSSDVEVGTVGGTLRYRGSIEPGGAYTFGSHGGSIYLYLPDNVNAQVEALSLAGNIEIDYPGAPSEAVSSSGIPGLSEKELSFELGSGSAQIEIESFGGAIYILRAGGR